MEDEELISIRKMLENPDDVSGWLYLPEGSWNLDTKGVFAKYEKGTTKNVPNTAKVNGWKITIDSDAIEDIVDNANAQLGSPSIDQLFDAFVFYNNRDAFIEFK